jgi:hypothetical protein
VRKRHEATTPVIRVIDLAHPPLRPADVEEILLQEWMAARGTRAVRVIKVIHGYGSKGTGGATRQTVRNWASRMGSKLRGVIPGENYSMFDPGSRSMRKETGLGVDPDLDAGNQGVTYLWIQ